MLVLAYKSTRDRVRFVAVVAAVSVVIWLPHLIYDLPAVIRETASYRALAGLWGAGLVMEPLGEGPLTRVAQDVLVVVSLALVWRSSAALRDRNDLPRSASAAFLVFLTVTPGFGVQYLAWPVPFLAVASPSIAAGYSAVAGALLFAT